MAGTETRMRWVNANGAKTRYAEAGNEGPIIVALHGGGAGSSGQAGMGRLLPLLSDAFWLIAPDSVGGYGETDTNVQTPLGLLNRATQIEDIADTLCLDKFTIMGNSQGAFSAAYYALHNPHRIEKLILLASGSISTAMGLKQRETEAQKALQSYDGTREGMRRLLEALIIDPSKLTDQLIDTRQAAATRPGAMEAFKRFSDATRKLRTDPARSHLMDMRQTLPAFTKSVPTIFIWGEQDTFALPETGRQLEKLLPDVKFHWVPGAGHQVQTDKPEEVAKIIRAFING